MMIIKSIKQNKLEKEPEIKCMISEQGSVDSPKKKEECDIEDDESSKEHV